MKAGHPISPLLPSGDVWDDAFPLPLLPMGAAYTLSAIDLPPEESKAFIHDPANVQRFTDAVSLGAAAAEQVMRSAYAFCRATKRRRSPSDFPLDDMSIADAIVFSDGPRHYSESIHDIAVEVLTCGEAEDALVKLFGPDGCPLLVQCVNRMAAISEGIIRCNRSHFNTFHDVGCSALRFVLQHVNWKHGAKAMNRLADAFARYPGAFDHRDVECGLRRESARFVASIEAGAEMPFVASAKPRREPRWTPETISKKLSIYLAENNGTATVRGAARYIGCAHTTVTKSKIWKKFGAKARSRRPRQRPYALLPSDGVALERDTILNALIDREEADKSATPAPPSKHTGHVAPIAHRAR